MALAVKRPVLLRPVENQRDISVIDRGPRTLDMHLFSRPIEGAVHYDCGTGPRLARRMRIAGKGSCPRKQFREVR